MNAYVCVSIQMLIEPDLLTFNFYIYGATIFCQKEQDMSSSFVLKVIFIINHSTQYGEKFIHYESNK